MKLTVWDEMPPTPPPSVTTRFFSQGRTLATKASERASFSVKRRTAPRPSISSPMPAIIAADARPVRRRSFRPLELSIYLPNNRLSDLPEFDAVSFTEVGEIKLPPRALVRTRSAEVVCHELPAISVPVKAASMFERRTSRAYRDTVVSACTDSRPSSSYDALHSHPVSWVTLAGSEPQFDVITRPHNSVAVLSPMQEEFTPPCTAGLINDIVSDFAEIEEKRVHPTRVVFEPPAPSPKVQSYYQEEPIELPTEPPTPRPQQPASCAQLKTVPCYTASTTFSSQRLVSQWLGGRSHSGSVSTIASNTTTSSFAEHRRKRSQFYMLSSPVGEPPRPLTLGKSSHQRSMTASTVVSNADTFGTDNDDMESMTTAPTATDLQSRSGTIKSTSTSCGLAPMSLRPIVSGVPDLPFDYGKVVVGTTEKEMDATIVIREINGPLRSPIGVAF